VVEVRRDPSGPGPQITGFAVGGFRIDGQVYRAAQLTPERVWAWDAPVLAELTRAHFSELLATRPEFILLGTGPSLVRPPRALMMALESEGCGLEAMDSRAAARAWGVLRGEGREVCAALMAL